MNDSECSSEYLLSTYRVLHEKQDDYLATGSLCIKEEFFKQETNINMFLNESKQCKPLGMIVKLKIIYYMITF